MGGQKVWNTIITDIKSRVSAATFRTWFSGTFVLEYKQSEERDFLVMGIKNNFLREQLSSRYLPIIEEIAKKKGFSKTEVVFVVAKSQSGDNPGKSAPLFSGIAPTYFVQSRKIEGLNPSHTFENFVVGPSNNLAYLAFQQVLSNLGSLYNPLFIYGPTGVGKTHLLQACGNEILNRTVDAKILYASAEKFANDYIESLNNRTTQLFRQKYRGVDVLLVDDVQFLAGKQGTCDEFFFTFNELFLSGKQIILAGDRHPREFGKLQDRLLSRLLGGMTCDIAKPDLELKTAIIRAKCREKGINLEDDVVSYIAQSSQGGVRELEGILVQVLLLTKLAPGKVSIEQIRASFEKNGHKENFPTPGKIVDSVSRHFGISSGDLCGNSRKARFVYARQILMYLLRQELGFPLSGIGQIVGGRDHSTVIYGIDKIDKLVRANQDQRDEIVRIQSIFSS